MRAVSDLIIRFEQLLKALGAQKVSRGLATSRLLDPPREVLSP